MKAILMLEDGKQFSGESMGVSGEKVGEVIFNTAVVGYQEMITDPANAGKILVLTYPLIGNYGCAPKFNESNKAWLSGLVIKEKSRIFSNWQAKQSFDDYVLENNLLTIHGIDTRTLTVHLRQKGSMLGVISTKTSDAKELLSKIQSFRLQKAVSLLPQISVRKDTVFGSKKSKKKVVVLDIGVTHSLIKQLDILGLNGIVLPYKSNVRDILKHKPKGLIISSGPEEDPSLKEVAVNIKPLVGKLPILGISSGHQVLATAIGAKITKLKVGHRGVNYPVQTAASFKGEITVQNHGLVVDTDSLNKIKDVKVSGFNLNDRTVEEIESKKMKFLGIQYSPVSPGFNEVNPVLIKFSKMLGRVK